MPPVTCLSHCAEAFACVHAHRGFLKFSLLQYAPPATMATTTHYDLGEFAVCFDNMFRSSRHNTGMNRCPIIFVMHTDCRAPCMLQHLAQMLQHACRRDLATIPRQQANVSEAYISKS